MTPENVKSVDESSNRLVSKLLKFIYIYISKKDVYKWLSSNLEQSTFQKKSPTFFFSVVRQKLSSAIETMKYKTPTIRDRGCLILWSAETNRFLGHRNFGQHGTVCHSSATPLTIYRLNVLHEYQQTASSLSVFKFLIVYTSKKGHHNDINS